MENTDESKYGVIPDLDWLPINKLIIDETYQRNATSKRSLINIKKIKKNFQWSRFSPLTVASLKTTKGDMYAVIDGQHRLLACKDLGDISEVPCWIIPATSIKQQADDFIEINKNRVAINNFSIYKAKLAAGDENCLKINNFLQKHDIHIPFNGYCSVPRQTLALACIEKHLRHNNGNELSAAFDYILAAFPTKNGQLKYDILDTLVQFKIRNGNKIKDENIIDTLKSFGSVDNITAKAKELHALDSSLKVRDAHYKVFLTKYKESIKRHE